MKTKYDNFSNIGMQYGISKSLEEIATNETRQEQFNEAMKLVESMDRETLGILSLYIDVLLNDSMKKIA